ncbi:hypothetical protein AAF712_000946 [Marasmius tenuissimus]|uniref:Elongator complex protein 5 n=1 Tax=Marasmius tenuissimus TaxID=585030 RepID=A0ABR3AEK6_9AGAR
MSLHLHDLHDQRLILLQSSFSQSAIPILRQLLSKKTTSSRVFLFCFLYPPSCLADDTETQSGKLVVHDFLDLVPNYHEGSKDPFKQIISTVQDDPNTTIDVVIDSLDTLASDIGSVQAAYTFLRSVLSSISKSSRLILHICTPSPLLPLLTSAAFSSSLAHIIARPPEILTELAKEYLTFPPPISPEAKFWSVYIPLSEREHESERLILEGRGSGNPDEFVVEVILRGATDASGRRKGVERVLEGWDTKSGPVRLEQLTSLSQLWKKVIVEEKAPDPTQNISFNLQLTPSQQEARAKVPLPYVLDGENRTQQNTNGAILYDPDSADDIDDDDPDEDLDI